MSAGRVVGGSVSDKLIIRLKHEAKLGVGDILVVEDADSKYFIKITNMSISSMLPPQFIEEIAGQKLEHNVSIDFFDEKERFYRVCEAKTLKVWRSGTLIPGRTLPNYFAEVRKLGSEDFEMLKSKGEVEIGALRMGSCEFNDIKVKLRANKLISHHVLVSAATGKGKSNFARVFVKGLMGIRGVSTLVLDPHNEYYGDKGVKGLRDYDPSRIVYFTPRPENYPGSERLTVYAEDLEPSDFFGIINITEAQQEAMDLLRRKYGREWIKELFNIQFHEVASKMDNKVLPVTVSALKRKLNFAMELEGEKGLAFTLEKRDEASIFEKIKRAVLDEKVIIIDTSLIGDEAEKLIASSVARDLFLLYRKTKQVAPDRFEMLPELMVLFEEAPRVLGKEVLSQGSNIFERIAREGRKFKVGMCAITQMPGLLPKEILSQMNTKIILGLPSPSDRQAVIESSSQNIQDESMEIQMLDKGEAIITSPFIEFPMPVKVFFFDDVIKESAPEKKKYNIGVS